jgi:hypothetical protein
LRLYYGEPDLDLIDVIREVHGPTHQGKLSILELKKNLDLHVVSTLLVRLTLKRLCTIKSPAVIHLAQENAAAGHFIVLMPQQVSSKAQMWDGVTGCVSYDTKHLPQDATGYCLLTSSRPINDPTGVLSAANKSRHLLLWAIAIVSLALLFLTPQSMRQNRSVMRLHR